MLKALERLGCVVRERCEHDRRQLRIRLTKAGEQCIRAAYQALVRAVRRLVIQAICFGAHRDPDARFRHLDTLESYLNCMRRQFYDYATLYYRWGHPDD
jgi:DNA-binding MarR family transcriptional regulator